MGAAGDGIGGGGESIDKGIAHHSGSGSKTSKLQGRQGVLRNRVLHACTCSRHPGLVDVFYHRVPGAELHRRVARYEAEPVAAGAPEVWVFCFNAVLDP